MELREVIVAVAHRELDAVGYARLVQERDEALRRAEDLRRQLFAIGEVPRGR